MADTLLDTSDAQAYSTSSEQSIWQASDDEIRRVNELLSSDVVLTSLPQIRARLVKHLRLLETQTSTLLQTHLSQGRCRVVGGAIVRLISKLIAWRWPNSKCCSVGIEAIQ
jgi:hypothetical protein